MNLIFLEVYYYYYYLLLLLLIIIIIIIIISMVDKSIDRGKLSIC